MLVAVVLAVLGCNRRVEVPPAATAPHVSFRDGPDAPPPGCGRITGRVVWAGKPMTPELIHGLADTPDGAAWSHVPNPYLPKLDDTSGLADVLVQLAEPPAAIAQHWKHPTLHRVTLDDTRFLADGRPLTRRLIQVNSEIELTGTPAFAQIRGRGASFFTRTFPTASTVHTVALRHPGVVELSRPNGQFWCLADLIVCEHPYVALTDAQGNFDLGSVPPGKYSLNVSLRNWEIAERERDPETGRIIRLIPAATITRTVEVAVTANDAARVQIDLRR